ncbi:hypothetical protein LMH73_007900 [Vibrio splendidus]|nr:hypothetical protein [Vibrio splendidus]MCC4883112.1 hypothetical protein [Vibrio splendidus]
MQILMLLVVFSILFYFKEEIVYGIKALFGQTSKEEPIEEKEIEDYTIGEVISMAWRKAKYYAKHTSTIVVNENVFVTRSIVAISVAIGLLLTYLCVNGNDVKLSYTIIGLMMLYLTTDFKSKSDTHEGN